MSDSFLTAAERHARWWTALQKIGAGIVFVLGILIAAGTYLWNRATTSVIERVATRLDPLCFRPLPEKDKPEPEGLSKRIERLDSRFDKLEKRLDDPADPHTKLGSTLDNIQRMLDEQQKKRTTPPPVVGPTATGQGRQ